MADEQKQNEEDLIVIATRPSEMVKAKERTVSWTLERIAACELDLETAKTNLAHAKKSKWRQTGFARIVNDIERKIEFYQKLRNAFEAGYVVVPNFPLDIFAVRTTKKTPIRGDTHAKWIKHEQHSDVPAVGEGEYRSALPAVEHSKRTENDNSGKAIVKHNFWADEWLPVDFPVKIVHPHILDATTKALALNLFDEIGLSSTKATNTPKPSVRAGDPMVIGQIIYKASTRRERRVSFLLAWWITQKDLEV